MTAQERSAKAVHCVLATTSEIDSIFEDLAAP
jgi:hypothetical protein